MRQRNAVLTALLTSTVLLLAGPTFAAEVTPDRLINADKEPHNWLMNHRTYDAQRHSPLDKINKSNVKSLKLAYAVALGGTSANENLQSTPLAEDGYLYIVDQWGVVYKIDGRSGTMGRIVWRMDPKQEKTPLANRGVALWGNFVISNASYPPRVIATDKDTGKVAWETNLSEGQVDVQLSAAPLPVNDKIIVGAAGGDRGVRDYIAALDAATGKLLWRKYTIPAPGEPGSETWKDNNNSWQTGGAAMWVTGSYDAATNQVLWGTGPCTDVQPLHPPRRQSLHQQPDLLGSRYRQDELVLSIYTGRYVGLRRSRHSHPDRRPGGWPRPEAGDACGAQWLPLQLRAQQRAAGPGQALYGGDHLDQRHRSEDRQAGRL
jgi:glucose dehydrogenase